MKPIIQDRKFKEQEFHDQLRGELAHDPYYTSNTKFYSINQCTTDFVNHWLARRCEGKRALDYCCGNGKNAFYLAEAHAEAYGIDISPVSIEVARKRANERGLGAKMHFSVMDAEATEFPDDFFDLIMVNGVLHHLDLGKAYRELARILKPDGEVICVEALRHNVFIHAYRKLTPHLRSKWETEHILGRKEIGEARQFFDQVEVLKFFHLSTIAAVPFRAWPVFEPMRKSLEALDSVLLKVPSLRWQAWMAVFLLSKPRIQRY